MKCEETINSDHDSELSGLDGATSDVVYQEDVPRSPAAERPPSVEQEDGSVSDRESSELFD